MGSIGNRVLAAATLLILASIHAQAAEPRIIALSCDGKDTLVGKKDTVVETVNKMGLVVNLATKSVDGFGVATHIDTIDAANISFGSSDTEEFFGLEKPKPEHSNSAAPLPQPFLHGDIDRVTGVLSATYTDPTGVVHNLDLLCKAVNRVF